MRAMWAFALTILVSVPLSGCITNLLDEADEPELPAAEGPEWLRLNLPADAPANGLFGVWVPRDALALRVMWPTAPGREGNWSAPYTARTAAPEAPVMTIYGPDGSQLFVGPPEQARPIVPGGPRLALDRARPDPGLHVFAFRGAVTPPEISLHVEAGTNLAPVLPLPFHYDPQMLVRDFGAFSGFFNVQGSMPAPRFPVSVHPDVLGVGAGGYVQITNVTGGVIATTDIPVTSAPAVRDYTLGLDPGAAFRFDTFDAASVRPGTWSYDARLAGSGTAYAWLGVSADPGTPYAPTETERRAAAADAGTEAPIAERTTLAGAVGRWDGAWFDMPEDALFAPRFSEDGTNRFRIYDTDGNRLLWDVVGTQGGPYPLPAGRLIVVNDGPADLAVDILGRPGPDSALHAIGFEVVSHRMPLEAAVGWAETTTDLNVPGPVLSWASGWAVGYSSDAYVTLAKDGAVVAAAPRSDAVPYEDVRCCPLPVVTLVPGDAHWLDGGRYSARVTASQSAGTIDLNFVHILLDSAFDDGAPPADPSRALPGDRSKT